MLHDGSVVGQNNTLIKHRGVYKFRAQNLYNSIYNPRIAKFLFKVFTPASKHKIDKHIFISVLADVGSLFAGGLELAWKNNKDRIKRWGEKLRIIKPK